MAKPTNEQIAAIIGQPMYSNGTNEYNYKYPGGLPLAPDSTLHAALVKAIQNRVTEGRRNITERESSWDAVDRSLQMYVRPDYGKNPRHVRIPESNRGRDGAGGIVERQVIMPFSYATLETLMTYLMATIVQTPVFRYEGEGPEDVLVAALMQAHVQRQVERFNFGLSAHTLLRDSLAYGIGVGHPVWKRVFGPTYKRADTAPGSLAEAQSLMAQARRSVSHELKYEGTQLENINPRSFYMPYGLPVQKIQEAEFVGWSSFQGYLQLLRREQDTEDFLFNVKHLQSESEGSPPAVVGLISGARGAEKRDGIEVVWMYIDLIPKDWGIGSSERPSKWLFGLAANKYIIAATPLGLDHDLYPVVVGAPDFDGYSSVPLSRMESIGDIQVYVDFLFNSHKVNIEQSLNGQLVVDPSQINIQDLLNPSPERVIRTRRAQWGRGGIRDAIHQLQFTDITAPNLGEVSMMEGMMRDTTGATDPLSGRIATKGPRISASASQGARSSGLSRMEKIGTVLRAMVVAPLARMYASHTQQLASRDMYVKLHGETEARMLRDFPDLMLTGKRISISPLDLVGDVDLDYSQNIVPGSEDVETWSQLFQVLMTSPNPQLQAAFNIPQIFRHIALQMGAKDVDNFMVQAPPQVMPDAAVEKDVAAGNLVPMADVQPPT